MAGTFPLAGARRTTSAGRFTARMGNLVARGVGKPVFVTSEVDDAGKKSLLTLWYDRNDGHELWRHDFGLGMNQSTHKKSNLAVNTPAVTEDAVYVAFGNADIARYSHDGQLVWVTRYLSRLMIRNGLETPFESRCVGRFHPVSMGPSHGAVSSDGLDKQTGDIAGRRIAPSALPMQLRRLSSTTGKPISWCQGRIA